MMEETKQLNTGATMPAIGFGTWMIDSSQTAEAVAEALRIGYRLIDTAKLYDNERAVGEAIRHSGITRDKINLTTKLLKSDHGYHSARAAFEESLDKLGLEYIDLYLIHSPKSDQRHNSWRALEELYEEGRAKAVGVSNYDVWHLEELLDRSDLVPAVNQILFNPFVYSQQKATVDFCDKHGIIVEAYSPLTQGQQIEHPVISEIAGKHKKSNAQILLRWAIQHGTVPLPKSVHPERMRENIEVFRFELSEEDMQNLNSLSSTP